MMLPAGVDAPGLLRNRRAMLLLPIVWPSIGANRSAVDGSSRTVRIDAGGIVGDPDIATQSPHGRQRRSLLIRPHPEQAAAATVGCTAAMARQDTAFILPRSPKIKRCAGEITTLPGSNSPWRCSSTTKPQLPLVHSFFFCYSLES